MWLVAATEPAFVWAVKYIVDYGFEGKVDFLSLFALPIGLVSIFVVRGLASFATGYLMIWVSSSILINLQRDVYESVLRAEGPLDNGALGRAINAITTEGRNALDLIERVAAKFLRSIFIFASLLVTVVQLHPLLGLCLATLVLPFVYTISLFGRRYESAVGAYVKANSDLAGSLEDTLTKFDLVRQNEAGEFEARRLGRTGTLVNGAFRSMSSNGGLIVPVSQTVVGIYIAALFWVRPYLADSLSDGGFVAINTALLLMLTPLRELAAANAAMLRSAGAAWSVFTSVDIAREQSGQVVPSTSMVLAIDFVDVSIRYPGATKSVLVDLSFSVKPGESLALIGPSGAGKTSVLNLIAGLLKPGSGTVRISGLCDSEMELDSLRSMIGYVGQDVQLFEASVAYNICYGAAESDVPRMWRVLRAVRMDSFVRSLPDAEHTIIGAAGVGFSGGQRQLLSIARALYRDAPIILLDEPTSALDHEAESELVRSLSVLMKDRTVVMATHSESLLKLATRKLLLGHPIQTIENNVCVGV